MASSKDNKSKSKNRADAKNAGEVSSSGSDAATSDRDTEKKNGQKKNGNSAAPVDSFQSTRETVESVVVAFVLAFLFRAFVAEAFVIPTGSMAPTLMGAHKDVFCEHCGEQYQASAS
ncbi:MAG: S26 family signal peptidase, partial [Planctomycetota bacterium]